MKKFGPYSEKVIKYFTKPKNVGKIKNPDGVGEAGNIICGDLMRIYLKIGKDKKGKEIIKDIKFETYGCLAAIASCSVLTEIAKGKTIKEALAIDRKRILEKLGGLPPVKIHCSLLGVSALWQAIYNYLKKRKRKIPKKLAQLCEKIEKEKKEVEKRHLKWQKMLQKK